MKAAVKAKNISGYAHTFSLHTTAGLADAGPGILGINWYDFFDTPKPDGECPFRAHAKIRGGHEVEMFGIDAAKKRVWCYQSWGADLGGRKNGTFWFSWSTLDKLLDQKGDATFATK